MSQDRSLALGHIHEALDAKMVSYAGYRMPVSYTTIRDEHMAVRARAGLFDVSHMGEFIVKGKEARQLIQALTSNDVYRLEIGDVQYSSLLRADGGIMDDLLVYRLDEDRCSEGEQAYMLVVNASNREKDLSWIEKNNTFQASVEDISDNCGLLALQGPSATNILSKLTDVAVGEIAYYHFTNGQVAGLDNILISATGYTGSGGFELYARNEDLPALWEALIEAGRDHGLVPAGLGARDTLRLEMGFCLYGNDIDETTHPFEAGLGWITKLKKEAPFLTRTTLQGIKSDGLKRKLIGFKCDSRRIPRHGMDVFNAQDERIGHVTSGGLSPMLDHPIGMAYIEVDHAKVGHHVFIGMGSKRVEAELLRPPFVTLG